MHSCGATLRRRAASVMPANAGIPYSYPTRASTFAGVTARFRAVTVVGRTGSWLDGFHDISGIDRSSLDHDRPRASEPAKSAEIGGQSFDLLHPYAGP